MAASKSETSTQNSKKIDGTVSNAGLSELEVIFHRLRELLSTEYERGGANAASRIFNLASANDGVQQVPKIPQEVTLTRAPRGAARLLVEKALAGGGAKTIREIRDTAKTKVEAILSYQTVRLELGRGKAEKRYKKTKNKWSLY